jgi:hypothetical protein
MITIREEQISCIDEVLFRNYTNLLALELRSLLHEHEHQNAHFPATIYSLALLARDNYRILTMGGMTNFIGLALHFKLFKHDGDFDGAIESILTWPDRAEDAKLELLTDYLNTK